MKKNKNKKLSLASSKIKNLLYVITVLLDVMCNKFGHPALSSVFQNYEVSIEFEIAVGMLKKDDKNSKAEHF